MDNQYKATQSEYAAFKKYYAKGSQHEIPAFDDLSYKEYSDAVKAINENNPQAFVIERPRQLIEQHLLVEKGLAGVDPLSEAYLAHVTDKYKQQLSELQSTDDLLEWIDTTITSDYELYDMIKDELLEDDLSYNIAVTLFQLKRYLLIDLLRNEEPISPWTIAATSGRELLTILFGAPRTTLPITVTNIVSKKSFIHEVTEDLCYGLVAATDRGTVAITMFGFQITTVPKKYEEPWTYPYYKISYVDEEYTFKTMKFLQGIVTGEKWMKMDIHKSIRSFVEVTKDGEVAMKF